MMMKHKRDQQDNAHGSAAPHDDDQINQAASSQAQSEAEPDTAGQVIVSAAEWEQLQQQLQSQQEQVLRIHAEADNQLKREQRQLERHRQLALESIMRELLDVRDSMEMGLQASLAVETKGVTATQAQADATEQQQLQALRNGMEMTLKLLDKTMTNNHARIIDPQDQPFDPEWHEAISVLPDASVPKDTVLKVIQKGCSLHDRLLRPAMVIVSAG